MHLKKHRQRNLEPTQTMGDTRRTHMGETYIFLCSKVWFVPRLNVDKEVIFHVLILESAIKA